MPVFSRAFEIVIGVEGGYVDDPRDPGGATKYGICQRSYPKLDIPGLTLDQAKAIYRGDYWNPVCGDDLPPPLALLIFDAAVNNGVRRAAQWLQIAVGETQDGVIGPVTLAAIQAKAGKGAELLAEFQARRMAYMASLPGWTVFGLGWSRRLAALPYMSMEMTNG